MNSIVVIRLRSACRLWRFKSNIRTDFSLVGYIRVITGILDHRAFGFIFCHLFTTVYRDRYFIAGQQFYIDAEWHMAFQQIAQGRFSSSRCRRSGGKAGFQFAFQL
jgi:hypothetical protein